MQEKSHFFFNKIKKNPKNPKKNTPSAHSTLTQRPPNAYSTPTQHLSTSETLIPYLVALAVFGEDCVFEY